MEILYYLLGFVMGAIFMYLFNRTDGSELNL